MIYGQKAVEARQKAMAAAENVKQNIEFWNNVKQNIADRAPKAEVEEETGAAEVESEVKEEPKAEPKAEVETETETKAEPENEPKAKGKAKEKAETKAEEKAVSNTEGKVIEHALGIVEKLNYPKDKVHVIGSTDELRKAGKKGLADDVDAAMASGSFPTAWVETESGEVYLYAEGIKAAGMTEKDIEGTIYHEVIAHVGVRQLLGSKAGAFYKKVWSGMARVDQVRFTKYLAQSDNRPEYMELLKKYADGAKMSREEKALFDELAQGAADEYVAYLAENVDKVENRNALQAIVDYIRKVLAKVFANVEITDDDIYTLLAASKRKMEKKPKAESKADVLPNNKTVTEGNGTIDNNAQSANNKRDSKGLNDVNEGEVKTITDGKRRFQIVWHGSGADFEKFDSKFFLSGEGSMVYGAGHYVSNVEGTARLYATTAVAGHIKRTEAINKAQEEVYKKQREESEIVLQLDKKYNKAWNTKDAEEKHKDDAEYKLLLSKLDAARRGLSVAEQDLTKTIHEANPRHLYQIEIPDDNGKNYIDWNEKVGKSLIEKVKNGLLKAAEGNSELDVKDMEYLGLEDMVRFNDLYGTVGTYLGGDKQASEFFNNLGFVGIKVPTGNMRGGDGRGMNYVIFNDDDLKIKGHTRFQRKGAESALTQSRLGKLKDGEFAAVERKFAKDKNFSFTAGNKIETVDDVAFIFKQLEEAAVENAFLCMVKDGKPTVVHLNMGGFHASMVEQRILNEAISRVKPDKFYFVHNHPNGEIYSSVPDRQVAEKLRKVYPNIPFECVIIDTYKGTYGVFDEKSDLTQGQRKTEVEGEYKLPVYMFSKLAYNKDYQPSEKFINANDTAEFISSHRLGERDKIGFLILQSDNRCVGNIFLTQKDLSEVDAIADKIASSVNTFGGKSAILYGRMEKLATENVVKIKDILKDMQISLMDAMSFEKDGYIRSAVNMDVLENEAEYEGKTRFQFKKHQNADGVLLYDDAFDNVKLYTDFDSVELEGADYGGLMYTINNNYYGKHEGKRISIEHFSPSGRNKKSIFAVFENYGFNKYRFIVKGEYDDAKAGMYNDFVIYANEVFRKGGVFEAPDVIIRALNEARRKSGLGDVFNFQFSARPKELYNNDVANSGKHGIDGKGNNNNNTQRTEENGSGGIDTRFQRVVNRATPEEIQQRHAERFAKRFEDIAEAQLALSAFVDEARQNDKSTDPATMDKNTLDHLRNILQAPTLNRQARNMKEYAKIGAMNVKAYAQSLEELVKTFEKMIPTDEESTSDAASMRRAIEKAISICRMACWLRGRGCLMRRDWNGLYHVFVKVADVQQLSCK